MTGMTMIQRLLAVSLALSPTLAWAKGECHSIEPELLVPHDVHATMAVIRREETCSVLIAVTDTSSEPPRAFDLSLLDVARHGEASIEGNILTYRRTDEADSERLSLRLRNDGGLSRGVTLIIRMQSKATGS